MFLVGRALVMVVSFPFFLLVGLYMLLSLFVTLVTLPLYPLAGRKQTESLQDFLLFIVVAIAVTFAFVALPVIINDAIQPVCITQTGTGVIETAGGIVRHILVQFDKGYCL